MLRILPFAFFFLIIKSYGQNYTPLLGKDFTMWCTGIGEFESGYSFYYLCKGDTVVNGVEYHPLFRHCKTRVDHSQKALIGMLREDTITQRVFFIEAGDSIEFILYDFSLTLGDSIFLLQPFHYCSNYLDTLGWYVVSQVDTFSTISGDKKYLRLAPLEDIPYWVDYMEWVEGVGSYQGAYLNDTCTDGFYNQGLTDSKYSDSSLVFYYSYPYGNLPEFGCVCGETSIGIDEEDNNSLVKIYPVPAENTIVVQLNDNLISNLRIINLVGKTILKSTLSETQLLDISKLSLGVYYLEISNQRFHVVKKFIKS